jgi:hypothetical protein
MQYYFTANMNHYLEFSIIYFACFNQAFHLFSSNIIHSFNLVMRALRTIQKLMVC